MFILILNFTSSRKILLTFCLKNSKICKILSKSRKMTAGFAANTALIAAKWQRKLHMNLNISWKVYIFFPNLEKKSTKVSKKICNNDVFLCFRFAKLVSNVDKISPKFSKTWSVFSKIVQSCNPFSSGHSGVCCTETREIADESVHFQNVCIFLMNLEKINKNFWKKNCHGRVYFNFEFHKPA